MSDESIWTRGDSQKVLSQCPTCSNEWESDNLTQAKQMWKRWDKRLVETKVATLDRVRIRIIKETSGAGVDYAEWIRRAKVLDILREEERR